MSDYVFVSLISTFLYAQNILSYLTFKISTYLGLQNLQNINTSNIFDNMSD